MNSTPRTLSELYPSKWLVASDLQKPAMVTIIAVGVEELRQQDGSFEPKLVLTFKNATKRMIANVTQAKRLAELLNTETFSEWVGARVKLAPGRTQNGKNTIVVVEATKIPPEAMKSTEAPGQDEQQPAPAGRPAGQGMTDQEAASLWHKE